ncbi:MAG: hypothetical protein ACXVP3_06680 [Actinomycetota bacterium]
MTDAPAGRPRGSFVLYAVAFVLLLAAGATFVASARGFLSSTRLLWVSAGLSALAISAAIAGLLVPRRR